MLYSFYQVIDFAFDDCFDHRLFTAEHFSDYHSMNFAISVIYLGMVCAVLIGLHMFRAVDNSIVWVFGSCTLDYIFTEIIFSNNVAVRLSWHWSTRRRQVINFSRLLLGRLSCGCRQRFASRTQCRHPRGIWRSDRRVRWRGRVLHR